MMPANKYARMGGKLTRLKHHVEITATTSKLNTEINSVGITLP